MSDGAAFLPLIPYPKRASAAEDTRISDDTRVITTEAAGTEARLLAEALAVLTGFGFDVRLGGSPDPGDIVMRLGAKTGPEGYVLRTGTTVTIEAATPAGLHAGAQTLRQLVAEDAEGWRVRGAEIVDEPRFRYRGAMLDVARHFFSVSDVCTYIDRITAFKINVLHLHLTDDQGWRLEIDGRPELTRPSSASGGQSSFYTQDDYRRIVEYAARRHITVVPEIDTPGHTHAVSVAYPELAEEPVINDDLRALAQRLGQDLPEHGREYAGWGVGFSSVKIGDPAVDALIDDVFGQLAALTPGPWLHFGGDECMGISEDDYAAFVRRTAQVIHALGKTPVAWHEAGRVTGLPAGTVGQYWGMRTPLEDSADAARRFVSGDGALILSPADAAYLDMKYDESSPLGQTWANGPTSLQRANDWDPAGVVPGVGDDDILGVEAPLWTETIATLDEVETMAFPRLPIIADIAWSPEGAPTRAWDSVRARLAAQGAAWKAEGIKFHPSEEIA